MKKRPDKNWIDVWGPVRIYYPKRYTPKVKFIRPNSKGIVTYNVIVRFVHK